MATSKACPDSTLEGKDEAFQHTPLDDANAQIRLFEFHLRPGTGEIRIKLRTWLVESCPEYTAISYLWGDATLCRTISINGKPFPVASNARYALEQVHNQARSGSLSTLCFWMDSLCIDQNNLDEKGKQVRLMGDIFELAKEVLACVGPHGNNSQLLINSIRDVYSTTVSFGARGNVLRASGAQIETAREVWNAALQNQLQLQSSTSYFLQAADAALDMAVLDFANREYWSRIWIVQEVRLAKVLKILCGYDLLNIGDLLALFLAVIKSDSHAGLGNSNAWDLSPIWSVLQDSHHSDVGSREDLSRSLDSLRPESYRLSAFLAFGIFRDHGCANFRDRVYAMLRIITWGYRDGGVPKIVPDYEVTKVGLLKQVIQDMTRSEEGIDTGDMWDTLTTLCEGIQLEATDPELVGLVERRQTLSKVHTEIKDLSTAPVDCEQRLHCAAASACYIESISPCEESVEAHRDRVSFFERDITCELQCLQVRTHLEETTVRRGWLCPNARPSHYIVMLDLMRKTSIDKPFGLVVQRSHDEDVEQFSIVGLAIIINGFEDATGWEFSIHLEVEDCMAILFLLKKVSFGYGLENEAALKQLLETRTTSAGSKSFARMDWWE